MSPTTTTTAMPSSSSTTISTTSTTSPQPSQLHDLVLDPSIRNWGVLPILVFVLCINLLRTYLTHLGNSKKVPEKEDLRRRQTLARADRLRTNGNFINSKAFAARKTYLNGAPGTTEEERKKAAAPGGGEEGAAAAAPAPAPTAALLYEEDVPGAVNPMSNPAGMMDMVKGQAYFGITQMVMMQFSEMFFSGFVLVKIPFALTNSFKGMLQRGIELSTLDASYVSATSWMFLVAFGVKDVQRLAAVDDTPIQEEAAVYAHQLGGIPPGYGNTPMGYDCAKVFVSTRQALEMTRHRFALEEVEKRLLGDQYPATKSATEAFLSAGAAGGGKKKGGSGDGGEVRRRPVVSKFESL